jgi:FtsP/CotA-like multicopper oxidase with cupredoxin domain
VATGEGACCHASAGHVFASTAAQALPPTDLTALSVATLLLCRAHRNNVYGDITLVSGVPYPLMELQPKWYRLRFLNTGITRPYLLKIKDAQGL